VLGRRQTVSSLAKERPSWIRMETSLGVTRKFDRRPTESATIESAVPTEWLLIKKFGVEKKR
jgi:hypothetical protein